MSRALILLTGATGYVGGRLLRSLRAACHRVRHFLVFRGMLRGIARRTEVEGAG